MLAKIIDKILEEKEDMEEGLEKKTAKMELKFPKKKRILLLFLIFFLAFMARIIVLLFVVQPGNAVVGDVFHHWQIAYLSKEIGFKEGFLRLWDFKGMEYYWGLLHPLVLILGFTLTRSVSIVVPQMVSIIFGSWAIVLIFLITERYFNQKTAFAAALFFSLVPLNLFHNTLGLQEPLGIFFLLLGIYLFPSLAFLAGFSWMLAGMARSEYWLFGLGLLLAVLIREKDLERKIEALFGYGLLALLYMKYLFDYTGNPIYPIYWNHLAIGLGEWGTKVTRVLPPAIQQIKIACQLLFLVFLSISCSILWKKPKSYLFLLLGFIYLAFVFSVFGFGSYLYGYQGWINFIGSLWLGKLFAFSWGFLGVLLAIFSFYLLPKKFKKLGKILGALVFIIFLVIVQVSWFPVKKHYLSSNESLKIEKKAAQTIADKYTGKGTIFLPGRSPSLTYFLVYDQGISGKNLASTFYSPFYYSQGENPFSEWDSFRQKIIEWLRKNQAELLVVADGEAEDREGNLRDFGKMIELEEGKLFELVGRDWVYNIYRVKL